MHLDFDRCYRAVAAKDARFDGQFITAVRTTGIYCRPSCPAITPKARNVVFLPTAAAAQQAGFRACRRCLPDAAPGSPLWNTRSDLAARAMRLIGDGIVERDGVPGLAGRLGYSTRQLNRVLTAELGAGALALARAYRAQTARVLIQTTNLTMTDIAFAAGFASIRQFNDTVRETFAVTPTQLRTEKRPATAAAPTVSLRLPYRQPLDADWLHWFLRDHAAAGVEHFADGAYTRSLRLPHGSGVVTMRIETGYVRTELTVDDMRDLAPAVARVRHLLDLDADPVAIADVVGGAGLRVPGSVDGAELLIRTMIGQQVSIAAGRTHTARLVAALGEPVAHEQVSKVFPTAAAIAEHGRDVLTGPARRIDAIVGAAKHIADGNLELHCAREAAELRTQLLELPGVGPWTADYVTMRLLAHPDVLLHTDLVVRKGAALLGLDLTATAGYAPWRSYLSMRLWHTTIRKGQP